MPKNTILTSQNTLLNKQNAHTLFKVVIILLHTMPKLEEHYFSNPKERKVPFRNTCKADLLNFIFKLLQVPIEYKKKIKLKKILKISKAIFFGTKKKIKSRQTTSCYNENLAWMPQGVTVNQISRPEANNTTRSSLAGIEASVQKQNKVCTKLTLWAGKREIDIKEGVIVVQFNSRLQFFRVISQNLSP